MDLYISDIWLQKGCTAILTLGWRDRSGCCYWWSLWCSCGWWWGCGSGPLQCHAWWWLLEMAGWQEVKKRAANDRKRWRYLMSVKVEVVVYVETSLNDHHETESGRAMYLGLIGFILLTQTAERLQTTVLHDITCDASKHDIKAANFYLDTKWKATSI